MRKKEGIRQDSGANDCYVMPLHRCAHVHMSVCDCTCLCLCVWGLCFCLTSWCRPQQGSIVSRWVHPRHSKDPWLGNSRHTLTRTVHIDGASPEPHPPQNPHRAVAMKTTTQGPKLTEVHIFVNINIIKRFAYCHYISRHSDNQYTVILWLDEDTAVLNNHASKQC